jgi:hypothetical protein
MAPADDGVACFATDVAREPRQGSVAERAARGHQPQHPLVVEREVCDVERHSADRIPAPHGAMEAARRHGQRGGERTGHTRQRRVGRGERLRPWQSRQRGGRLPGIV